MRYSEFRAEKLAFGSGAVEAANKTLAAARTKRSGMRWHNKSGQTIPGLRASTVRLVSFWTRFAMVRIS